MPEKDTSIHLPKTGFPMKGNLVNREPEMQKKWEEDNLYAELMKKRSGKKEYILHDGPPYANGNIHMGHTLNKVLKDIIVRYKSFKGFRAPYVPGWDCHGMPIEHKVMDKLGSKAREMSKVEIRKKCRDYALKYVDLQRRQFKRLGVMGEWEKPYLTLNKEYEDKMVDIFHAMYKKGMIYKGLKPVYWCASCETALAEAEVEYENHASPSVYVKFPVKDPGKSGIDKGAFFVIWTTTPWTLPANTAIALHPEYEYGVYNTKKGKLILAKELAGDFFEKTGIESGEEIKAVKGGEIEGASYSHVFMDRACPIITADYVTLDTGTGCVHTAPGHGQDDYISGKKYGLPIITPVDSKGRFTKEYPEMEGKFVFSANKDIVEMLDKKGALLGHEEITHSYPHCWRCKKPIIFRATNQWFISMEKGGLRKKALDEVKNVKWHNKWGEERIKKMLEGRPDWCISRQRSWGVPIFVFVCGGCGAAIVNDETIKKIHGLIKKEGSDGWFKYSAAEILGEEFKCPECGSKDIKKENDIFDVWFDSGASSFAVLENREELGWPADLYIEGSDQYRGWFQSSLLTAVGFREKSPYKEVISHGWVVDSQGRAMHKSLGNVVDPLKLIQKGGADILRLWVASEDFKGDQAVSEEIMARVTDSYRRARNGFRFMLGSLFDFGQKDTVDYGDLNKLDKYMLHRLGEVCEKIEGYYEKFEFYKVYREFINFCSVDLSSFYFDIVKDRLYTFKKDGKERRGAQTVIYKMLVKLTKLIAPILVYTSDEVWQFMPEGLKKEKHIQFELWDDGKEKSLDEKELDDWKDFLSIREKVMKEIEEKRSAKVIKHPYEADVIIKAGGRWEELFKKFEDEAAGIFIVSKAVFQKSGEEEVEISVEKASGKKCERCWRYEESTGKDPSHPGLCERCIKNI